MATDFRNLEAQAAAGEKIDFSFGANWQKYLRGLTPERMAQARDSLTDSLGGLDVAGRTFLDAGCGSGIFSLAALQLGAERVVSVDVDPNSIACARGLREGSAFEDRWTVVEGSLLQPAFVETLEPADVVYSWGVLHHTGAMWDAIEQVLRLVGKDGLFCLGLYRSPTRQGLHMGLKRTYNRLPRPVRPAMVAAYGGALIAHQTRARRMSPVRFVREYGETSRGMSLWRDMEDWLGGLPCEFATADDVGPFVAERGFELVDVHEAPPGAVSEYLIRRKGA